MFFRGTDLTLTIGSFGASAVLVDGAVRSLLARPRNLGGGHVVSALVRVTAWKRFQHSPGLAESVAVAPAIAAMYLTRTLHPPRGETAPIVGIGSDESHALSDAFAVIPATVGPLLLFLIGLLVNNIPQSRCYRRVGSNGRVPPMHV